MDFTKFLNTPLVLPQRGNHNPPAQLTNLEKVLSYLNFNNKKYIINKDYRVGYIDNEYPLVVKYLNGNKLNGNKLNGNKAIKQDSNLFFKEDEFNKLSKVLFVEFIMNQLKINNFIYDILYFDDELLKFEFSLGNLRKYKDIILSVDINYILVKSFRNLLSIYVIGNIKTINEEFNDIGLGYITFQGSILTNLYPGLLPRGWGSALLCLFLQLKPNNKEIKLEALDEKAKKFYEHLGFDVDIDYQNSLNLKINKNYKQLINYCSNHSIYLDDFIYVLKDNDDIYTDLYLNDVIKILHF